MIQELLYTSAPKGLKPGSRGFCTVLSSAGMSAPVATALESLSGYRPLYPPGDPNVDKNPVVFSHLQFPLGGKRQSILSRIADYGLDYSQRSNKLAHHVVIEAAERPSAGPAWLLSKPSFMRTAWNGELQIVPHERTAPQGDLGPAICTAWKEATGDAGWAGVLAESFLKDPDRLAYIIVPLGMDPLPLIHEAIALLPADRRWEVTFSTYFTKLPQGAICNWRCVVEGSPEANESRRYVQALRINLGGPMEKAEGGDLVDLARSGHSATLPLKTSPPKITNDGQSSSVENIKEEPPLRLLPSGSSIPPRPPRAVLRSEGNRQRSKSFLLVIGSLCLLVATGVIGAVWMTIHRSKLGDHKIVDGRTENAEVIADNGKTAEGENAKAGQSESIHKDTEPQAASKITKDTVPSTEAKSTPSDDSSATMPTPPMPEPSNSAATGMAPKTAGQAEVSQPPASPPEAEVTNSKFPFEIDHWSLKADKENQHQFPLKLSRKEIDGTILTLWQPSDANATLRTEGAKLEGKSIAGWDSISTATIEGPTNDVPSSIRIHVRQNIPIAEFDRTVVSLKSPNQTKPHYICLHAAPVPVSDQATGRILSLTSPIRYPSHPEKCELRLDVLEICIGESLVSFKCDTDILKYDEKSGFIPRNISTAGGPVIREFFASFFEAAGVQTQDDSGFGSLTCAVKIAKRLNDQESSTVAVWIDFNMEEIDKKLNKTGSELVVGSLLNSSNLHVKSFGQIQPLNEKFLHIANDNLNAIDNRVRQIDEDLKNRKIPKEDMADPASIERTKLFNIRPQIEKLIAYINCATAFRKAIVSSKLETLVTMQEAKNAGDSEFVPFVVYRNELQSAKGPKE